MLRDPEMYKDPERLNPERFLGENPEKDPREMVYGFGKRSRILQPVIFLMVIAD
jgi:cytochrome P450